MPHASLMKKKFRSFLDLREAGHFYDSYGSDESLGSSPSSSQDHENVNDVKSLSGGTEALKRAFTRTFSWRKKKGHSCSIPEPSCEKSRESCKIFIVGHSGTGKTAAVVRFLTGRYIHEYQSTEGECYTRNVNLDGDSITVQITSMTSKIKDYEDALADSCAGIILVYSITDFLSFCYLQTLLNEINTLNPVPVMLIGTKVDMEKRRCIHKSAAEKLAIDYGLIYYEVSAAANIAVEECFRVFIRDILGSSRERSRSIRSASTNDRLGRRRSSVS